MLYICIVGCPADVAGLKPGDIIVNIEGDAVRGMADVKNSIRKRKSDEKVRLRILRANTQLSGDLRLGEMPVS